MLCALPCDGLVEVDDDIGRKQPQQDGMEHRGEIALRYSESLEDTRLGLDYVIKASKSLKTIGGLHRSHVNESPYVSLNDGISLSEALLKCPGLLNSSLPLLEVRR